MIRLGTRRSPLALVQAEAVAAGLRDAGHEVELVEVVTAGDRDRALPDKAKWTSELERRLADGEIDLAVHSAKDVPGELPDGMTLVATMGRADHRDVLIGVAAIDDLPEGGRVGTASLRRAAQLRAARRDLTVVEARGNVDTRLGRLADGDLDAIVLAAAGLARLGRTPPVRAPLERAPFVCAPGQGALALEARADDAAAAAAAAALQHEASWTALRAERALAAALGADCTSAVGAHCRAAVATPDHPREQGALVLTGFVGTPDGSDWLLDEQRGDDPVELGERVAERLRRAGADDLLHRVAVADLPGAPAPGAGDAPARAAGDPPIEPEDPVT